MAEDRLLCYNHAGARSPERAPHRLDQTMKLRLGILLPVLALAACTFDGSALDSRPPCETDDDCATPNGVCIEGSCFEATPSPGPDTGPDSPDAPADAGCEPGTRICAGNTVEVCDDSGALTSESCDDSAFCDADACACDAGECVPFEDCEDGTRRCQGNVVLECDGGIEVVSEECSADLTCEEGECIEEQCEEDALSCVGEVLVRCAANGALITVSDCANSDAYCISDPEPYCEPRACAPSATRCTDDLLTVERCDERGIAWAFDTQCTDEELCNSGECIDRACEADTQDCNGVQVYTTCNDTGDDSTTSLCDEGTYCLDGGDTVSCEPQTCTPGQRRCLGSAEAVEVCDEFGAGFTEGADCGDNQFCTGGICSAQVCIPGSLFCVGDFSVANCDSRGSSFETVPCGDDFYCEESALDAECLEQACPPDASRCLEGVYDTIELCDSRGSAFEAEACADETACYGEACAPVICIPGEILCPNDFLASTCHESGTFRFESNCLDGTYCEDSTGCIDQVCAPGTQFCGADESEQQCNAAGSGASLIRACPFGCTGGECRPSECGDGVLSTADGEECDDGNGNGCDACFNCRLATAAGIDTSTLTTSSTTWDVGVSDVTIEAWVNATTDGAFFGIGSRGGSDFIWVGMEGNVVRAEVGLRAEESVALEGARAIDGRWHHIAVQRFSAWGLAIYVDGELDAFQHDVGTARSIDGAREIWIGSDGTTTPAVAELDQVHFVSTRLYAGAFGPSRIVEPGPFTIGLYDFDAGIGSGLVPDESIVGNDLVITGLNFIDEWCYGDSTSNQTCGDTRVSYWEECDDGNTLSGDGCDSTCALEVCSGGEVRGPSDKCYYTTSSFSWTNARDACGAGDLAILDSELENDFVAYFLGLSEAHWLGLRDRSGFFEDPDWEWNGGTSLAGNRGNPNWADGEPNGSGCGWGTTEECAAIWGEDSPELLGQWNDFCCDSNQRGLCER